jgi:hypothetical protein
MLQPSILAAAGLAKVTRSVRSIPYTPSPAEARIELSCSSAASCSSRRVIAASSAARRSRTSTTLAWTSVRAGSGSLTSLISHGIGSSPAPTMSQSKRGVSPWSARAMYPIAASLDARPSGCSVGLTSTGPTSISRSRDMPKSRSAASFALTNRPASRSSTRIASGSWPTTVS